jgi:hypothetical protein
MAIDTENKRRFVSRVLPKPDGSVGVLDRPHVAWVYPSLLYAPSLPPNILYCLFRDKRQKNKFRDKRQYLEFRNKREVT